MIRQAVLALTLFAAAPALSAQAASRTSFDVSALNNIALHCVTTPRAGLDYTTVITVTVDNGRAHLHRLIIDRTHGLYYGYDLTAFREGGSPQVRLHFSRLSSIESFQHTDFSGLTRTELAAPLADTLVGINTFVDVPLIITVATVPPEVTDHLTFAPVAAAQ